jgi:hypothetical protein
MSYSCVILTKGEIDLESDLRTQKRSRHRRRRVYKVRHIWGLQCVPEQRQNGWTLRLSAGKKIGNAFELDPETASEFQ